MWWVIFIVLCMLNQTCFSGIEPTWSWCIIFLIYFCMLLSSALMRIFVSVFISDIGLLDVFVSFWYQCYICFIECIWGCSFPFNFMKWFGKDWYCSLKGPVELFWKSVLSGLLFVGRLLIALLISLLVIGLFRFSVPSCFDWGVHVYLEICQCLLHFAVYCSVYFQRFSGFRMCLGWFFSFFHLFFF